MARKKKKPSLDPRQMTLFDLMADQVEKQLEQVRNEEYTRLGVNVNGESVFEMREDGSRMHSKDPSIFRIVDWERNSPEKLFRKRKHEFLTREELAAFQERELEKVIPLSILG